jgi:hypothetical protein
MDGFLSPNFWIFAIIAIPILIIAGRKDTNPSAAYLILLHVVPPLALRIPMIGMSYLFDIDFYFILSICLLVPAVLRIRAAKPVSVIPRSLLLMDYVLLAYGLLTAILFVHYQAASGMIYEATFTDSLRRLFVFFLETFVPYYAISRSGASKNSIIEMLAMYALGCALMAAVAMFEAARHWLVFAEFNERWGLPLSMTNYLSRGDALRAMASSGHPLALGFMLAVAFGVCLYLGTLVKSAFMRISVSLFWWLGLAVAYSRGPWLGAIFMYFTFAALRPRGMTKIFRAASVAILVAVGLMLSPLRERIVSVIPFLGGTVDAYNVTYRQRLLARCWEIIQDNFFFGDQYALLRMQDLRQGEGIIDIINGYVQVLLDNGFIGLSLFLSFILIALFKAWSASRASRIVDADLSLLGIGVVTCILGTMLMLADGNLGTGPGRIFYTLAAIATAYGYVARPHEVVALRRAAR